MADDSDDDEKTEEPSQYKIEESRKKGDVATSKELSSVILLSGTLMAFVLSGVFVYETFNEYLDWVYIQEYQRAYSKEMIQDFFVKTAWMAFKCVAPIFASSVVLGFASSFAQIGFLYSPEILNLSWDRINPINGFGRLFSKKALVDTIKGIFKITVVILITYVVFRDNFKSFMGFLHTDAGGSLAFGKYLMLKLGFSILLGLGVLALADFGWEKFSYRKKMMMTKQQAKEESKEKDGNPEVKNKIRQIQRQMATKRMMDDVKKADVIVTNPNHISVALKYDGNNMVAPSVVAKGSEHMALKIRELAKEHNVPIVENVILARTLYQTVKVGHGVPRTLYKAVAEVLSFVYRLKKKRKALE